MKMESSEHEYKNAERDILAKAERYQKKSDALEVLLHTSRSARSYVMSGERYYEFQYDEIPGSIVKHLEAFRDVLDIKVLPGNTIAVRIEINTK